MQARKEGTPAQGVFAQYARGVLEAERYTSPFGLKRLRSRRAETI